MAINFNYQNPTIPLAIGGAIDAHRTAYNSGRAQNAQAALNQQRANQSAGAQMFAQQMYGLANTAIAQEYQTQRDARLFTQSMQIAKANTDNAMNLYRDQAAIKSGFFGAEGVSPWQQAQQVADEKYDGDIGKMLDTRELDAAQQRLQVLMPLQAQQELTAKQAELEMKTKLGHQEQLYQAATPQQRASLDQIERNIADLQGGKYAGQLNPFETQRQLGQARQDLDRAYSSIQAAQPATMQDRVNKEVYKAPDGTIYAPRDIAVHGGRATNIPSRIEQIDQVMSSLEFGTPQYDMMANQRQAYIDNENASRLQRMGVRPEEIDSATYDENGIIKSVNKKDPATTGAAPGFNLMLKTMLEAERKVPKTKPDGTTTYDYEPMYTPAQAWQEAMKATGYKPQDNAPASSSKGQVDQRAADIQRRYNAAKAAGDKAAMQAIYNEALQLRAAEKK